MLKYQHATTQPTNKKLALVAEAKKKHPLFEHLSLPIMTNSASHPLLAYTEEARIAYLSLIAELSYIDRSFDDTERKHLEEQLSILEISDAGKARIYAAVFDLKDGHRNSIIEGLKKLGSTDLRYTLISDLFLMALANDSISEEEEIYINKVGEKLNINKEQIAAIKQVQINLNKIKSAPTDSEAFQNMIKECAGNLGAVGVPIAAIAASGSVFGLSAAGITSGLAALGAIVGGGMLAGTVLVVPAIAVGSAWGAKKLVKFFMD